MLKRVRKLSPAKRATLRRSVKFKAKVYSAVQARKRAGLSESLERRMTQARLERYFGKGRKR